MRNAAIFFGKRCPKTMSAFSYTDEIGIDNSFLLGYT
jgi:glutaredoxin-related protein